MLRVVEVACWALGIATAAIYLAARADAALSSAAEIARFEQTVDQPNFSMWSASRVKAYRESVAGQTGTVLGVLTIPSVQLKVPVYDDASELHLNRGAALIAGTALPSEGRNTGIAGHRDGFFRSLKDIRTGDVLELQMRDGLYRYRVLAISVVDKSDARLLAATDSAVLTLVTCYPFYFVGHAPRRFVVRAMLEETYRSAP